MIWDLTSYDYQPNQEPQPEPTKPGRIVIPGIKWAKVQRHSRNHSAGRFHAWRGTEAICKTGANHGSSRVQRERIPNRACGDCLRRLNASKPILGAPGRNGGRNRALETLGVAA